MRRAFMTHGLGAAIVAGFLATVFQATPSSAQEATRPNNDADSRISDEAIPLQLTGFPKRPKPLLELGTPFLGTGRIGRGFTIPGGAAWTPSFLLFGTLRTAASVNQTDDASTPKTSTSVRTTQWANRLDLFGNLYLTASERFVFGLRPADEVVNGAPMFGGYSSKRTTITDGLGAGSTTIASGALNHFNLNWRTVNAMFFEGDFGELFPALDLRDRHGLDIGFSVGRQNISFQDGMLINDTIDAVGLTQANLKPAGAVNLRLTELFAWNGINRNTPAGQAVVQNLEAGKGQLLGLFGELDTRGVTTAFDAVYVRGNRFAYTCPAASAACAGVSVDAKTPLSAPATDGVYAGVGFVGRPGGGNLNLVLRVLTSMPLKDTRGSAVLPFGDPATRGTLAFGALSLTPHHSRNFTYLNAFYAFDQYRAAALDPTTAGPLAPVGILFAGSGLGTPGALSATATDAAGGAFGHQWFFAATRQQLLVEGGGRFATRACASTTGCSPQRAYAGAARYEVATGRRGVLVLEGSARRDRPLQSTLTKTLVGGRAELQVKF